MERQKRIRVLIVDVSAVSNAFFEALRGLLAMRRKGCRTIGQDEASSIVYGMPKVAFDIGEVEKQAAVNNIPKILSELLS